MISEADVLVILIVTDAQDREVVVSDYQLKLA